MSGSYSRLRSGLKALLPEDDLDALGRAVAFVRRLRTVTSHAFVWAVVLSRFGRGRPAFAQARGWFARLTDIGLCPRPFQMRFKSIATVKLFAAAFDRAVARWLSDPSGRAQRIQHPLNRHFPDVVVWDATVITIATTLRRWFGVNRGGAAAIKVFLGISVFGNVPLLAKIARGPAADVHQLPSLEKLQKGSLVLLDRGFVSVENILQLGRAGLFYLCPLKRSSNAVVVSVNRAPAWFRREFEKKEKGSLELRNVLRRSARIRDAFDLEVVMAKRLFPRSRSVGAACTRLVILPGPEGKQRIYTTNVPVNVLGVGSIRETYRLRWQIELVFKEMKQHLNLESVPTKDRHALQVFVWASLIALAVSRQVMEWLKPSRGRAGLASHNRPMLLSRALVGTIRLLGLILRAPRLLAQQLVHLFSAELREDALRPPVHTDSFERLRACSP
jgi:hypothetical protein